MMGGGGGFGCGAEGPPMQGIAMGIGAGCELDAEDLAELELMQQQQLGANAIAGSADCPQPASGGFCSGCPIGCSGGFPGGGVHGNSAAAAPGVMQPMPFGHLWPQLALGGISGMGFGFQSVSSLGASGSQPRPPALPAAGMLSNQDTAKEAKERAAARAAILDEKRCASREEAERFARESRLDNSAADIFLKEPADVQANVIDRGSLGECKNPSAALMGRLRDARQNRFKPTGGANGGHAPSLGLGGGTKPSEVEAFIEQNKIDMGAARALRAESADVQQSVMDRGTLDGFHNPSALVMARIKDVKLVIAEAASRNIKPGTGGSGGSSGQVTRELTRTELRAAVEARKSGRIKSVADYFQGDFRSAATNSGRPSNIPGGGNHQRGEGQASGGRARSRSHGGRPKRSGTRSRSKSRTKARRR